MDLALGVAFPLHAHFAMNCVIADYAEKFLGKSAKGPSRVAMLGLTGVTLLGFLRLNLTGEGITGTVKRLWRKST